MQPRIKLLAALLAVWLTIPMCAWAAEFRSVAAPGVVLYDAPSAQAKKLFVADQFYPVEVIVNLGDWIKVRDRRGELAWVETGNLTPARMVLVSVDRVDVRETADAQARVIFRADRDVVLELLENVTNGWVKVRHRDGLTGFVQFTQVWGL